jgi:hypothetical protein
MLDVSMDGCRVELVEAVSEDENVIARLPNLEPLAARISWVSGSEAGLQFRNALHPAVFEHLLSNLNSSERPVPCGS